ncbi:MAG TPA: hypothetical protein VJ021_02740 [Thermoplasmata archaeon]|nr:hypothetical protein [Thermoplasmata archaeon]
MSESPPEHSVVGLLTLREVRGYLRRSHAIGMAVFIALAYALGSMILGGMLVFARFSGGYSVLLLWGNALGLQSWNYPGLLIEAPWGVIELPFFATLSMVLVSAGVGIGMAVAILLGVQQIRNRRSPANSPAATGTIAGLTPALIALVTLGACCSTTAAATAGVSLVAQASGSSTSNLLLNNWYLGVFQIVVVYIALIAQELLLRVYGRMFGANDPGFAATSRPSTQRLDRRTVATAAMRAALLAGGVTWSLAVIADWTAINPSNASAALWFNWLIEHWLVGGFAVFSALSPRSVHAWFLSVASTPAGRALRAALLLGAGTLALWVPPPLAGAGVEGFGNELLGAFGVSSSWGAVGPAFPWGLALALRWGFQYLLLAAFAGAVAIAPEPTLNWLSESEPIPGRTGIVESAPPTSPAVPLDAR